jgi:hypothetical protein
VKKEIAQIKIGATLFYEQEQKNAATEAIFQNEARVQKKGKSRLTEEEKDSISETVMPLVIAFEKSYQFAITKAEKEVGKIKNQSVLYPLCCIDAFVRINGEDNFPEHLLIVDGKLQEVLDNSDLTKENYQLDAKYIEGESKGGELPVQIKSGIFSEDQIDAAITKDTKGKVKNDYAAGMVTGKVEGEIDAKAQEHGSEIPDAKAGLNRGVIKENSAIKEDKSGNKKEKKLWKSLPNYIQRAL